MNRRTFLGLVAVSAPMLAANAALAEAKSAESGKSPIDTFFVPADGQTIPSTARLRVGKKYSIVVSGLRQYTYYFDDNGVQQPVLADAMYGLKADGSLDYRAPVIQIDTITSEANVENFAAHRYVFHVELTGDPQTSRSVNLRVLDSEYSDNDFGHTIEIYTGHLKKVP
jgi:hypothetical protein